MNRLALLAAGSATVIGVGAVAAVAAPGATASKPRLTFHATALQHKNLGSSHEVEVDVLRHGGHKAGYGAETCFFGGQGDRCTVTITLKSGVLYGHYTFPITNGTAPTVATGRITGGLGRYHGAHGKIRVVATASSERITLTY